MAVAADATTTTSRSSPRSSVTLIAGALDWLQLGGYLWIRKSKNLEFENLKAKHLKKL